MKILKCISRLNIHYYSSLWYKSYITSLKAVIAGKSVIFAGRDIDRILHFIVYDKMPPNLLTILSQEILLPPLLAPHDMPLVLNDLNDPNLPIHLTTNVDVMKVYADKNLSTLS